MIDIKELQLGDWVLVDACMIPMPYVQIDGIITPNNIVCIDSAEREFTGDELMPVSLTPEILKNSGFEVYEDPMNKSLITAWTGYGKDNEDDIEVDFLKEQDEIRTKIDVKGHLYHTDSIVYVHQLQHALRMSEIDIKIKVKK